MSANAKPVTCSACGQSWKRDPALEVVCPTCRAPIGSPCKRPSGHGAMEVHRSRDQLALDDGLVELCPEGPTMRALRAASHQETAA
jgi:hypothetical protein